MPQLPIMEMPVQPTLQFHPHCCWQLENQNLKGNAQHNWTKSQSSPIHNSKVHYQSYYSKDTPIGSRLVQPGYIIETDAPFRAKFVDASHLKVGRQDLPNRFEFMKLKFDWIGDRSFVTNVIIR